MELVLEISIAKLFNMWKKLWSLSRSKPISSRTIVPNKEMRDRTSRRESLDGPIDESAIASSQAKPIAASSCASVSCRSRAIFNRSTLSLVKFFNLDCKLFSYHMTLHGEFCS